jgi:hypothetical protein
MVGRMWKACGRLLNFTEIKSPDPDSKAVDGTVHRAALAVFYPERKPQKIGGLNF